MEDFSVTACERWILQNTLPSASRSLRAVQTLLENSTEFERKQALNNVVLAVEHLRFHERKHQTPASSDATARNRALAVEALKQRLQTMATALGMRFALTGKTHCSFHGQNFTIDIRISADEASPLVEEVRVVEHSSSAFGVCPRLATLLRAGLYAECQQRLRQISLQFSVVPNGTRNALFMLEADLAALNWYFEVKMRQINRLPVSVVDSEESDRSLSNTYPMVACGVLSSTNGLLPIKSQYFYIDSPHYGRVSKYAEIGFTPLPQKADNGKTASNCVYTVSIIKLQSRKAANGFTEHVDLRVDDSQPPSVSNEAAVPGAYYIRPSTPMLIFTTLLDYLHTLYQCETIVYPNSDANDSAAAMDDLLAFDDEYDRQEHNPGHTDENSRNYLFPALSMTDYLHKIHHYDTAEPAKATSKLPPLAKYLGFYRKSVPSQIHLYSFTPLRARVPAATSSVLRENCCMLVYGFRVKHLTHIPRVLNVLRRQQLINTLMLSCVEQQMPLVDNSALGDEFETLLPHVDDEAENVYCFNILLNSMLSIPTLLLDADAAVKGFALARTTEREAKIAIADAAVQIGDCDVDKRKPSKKLEIESLIMCVRFEHPSRRNVLMQMQVFIPNAHTATSEGDDELADMMQLHNIHETIRCEVHFTPPRDIYGLPVRMAKPGTKAGETDTDGNSHWLGMCSAADDVERLGRIATSAMRKTLSVPLVLRTLIVFMRRQVEQAFEKLCTPADKVRNSGGKSNSGTEKSGLPQPPTLETNTSVDPTRESSVMPTRAEPQSSAGAGTSPSKQRRIDVDGAPGEPHTHSAAISASLGNQRQTFTSGAGPTSFSEKLLPMTIKLIAPQPYTAPLSSNNYMVSNESTATSNNSYGGSLKIKLSNLNSGNITTTSLSGSSATAHVDSSHSTMIARKRGRPRKENMSAGDLLIDETNGDGPIVIRSSGSKKSAGGGGRKRSIVSLSGSSAAGSDNSQTTFSASNGGESLSSVYSDEAAVAGLSQYEQSKKKPGRPKKVILPSKIIGSSLASVVGEKASGNAVPVGVSFADSANVAAASPKKRRRSLKDDSLFAVESSDIEFISPNGAARKGSISFLGAKPAALPTVPFTSSSDSLSHPPSSATSSAVRPSTSSPSLLASALTNFAVAATGNSKPSDGFATPVPTATVTTQQAAATVTSAAAPVLTLKTLPKIPKLKVPPKTTVAANSTSTSVVTPVLAGQPPPLISSTSASSTGSNVKPVKTAKYSAHQQHNRPPKLPHRSPSGHPQGFKQQQQHGSPVHSHTFGSGPPLFASNLSYNNKRGPLLPTPPVHATVEPRPISGSSSALASRLLPPAARISSQAQMPKSSLPQQEIHVQPLRMPTTTMAPVLFSSIEDESPASPPLEERGTISFLDAGGDDTLYQQITLPPPVSSSNKNQTSGRLFNVPLVTSAAVVGANSTSTLSSSAGGLGGSMPAASNPTSPDPENDDDDDIGVPGGVGGRGDSRHYYYDDTEPNFDNIKKPEQQQKKYFFTQPSNAQTASELAPALAARQPSGPEMVRRGRNLAGILDRLSSQYSASQSESNAEQQNKSSAPAIIASSKQQPQLSTFTAGGSHTKNQQPQRGLLVPYTYNANDDDSASSSSTNTTEGGATEYSKTVNTRLLNAFPQAPPPVIPPSSTLVVLNDEDDEADKLMIDDDGDGDVASNDTGSLTTDLSVQNFSSQQLGTGSVVNAGSAVGYEPQISSVMTHSKTTGITTTESASLVAPAATSMSTFSASAADNDEDLFNVALA